MTTTWISNMDHTNLRALSLELAACLGNDIGQDEEDTRKYFKGTGTSHGYAEAFWFIQLVVCEIIEELCDRFVDEHELWDVWEEQGGGVLVYDASSAMLNLLKDEPHDVVSSGDPNATAHRIAKTAVNRLFATPAPIDPLTNQITSILTTP